MPPAKRLKQRSELDPSYLATRPEPSAPQSLIVKLPIRFNPKPAPETTPQDRKIVKLKVRFESPTPESKTSPFTPNTEPDTIDKVRQQCWLLDQLRIYGAVVAEQRAEIAITTEETGEAPDLASISCPYILSEFSIEERHRVGLPEDEELDFLIAKRSELEIEVLGEEIVDGFESPGNVEESVAANEYVGMEEVWDMPVSASGKILTNPAPNKVQTKVVKKRKKRKVSFDGTFVPEPLEGDPGVHIKPKRKPRAQKSAVASKKISAMDGAEEDPEDGEFVPVGEAKPKKRQSLLTAGKFGKVTKNVGGEKLAIKGNISLSFRK